MKNNDLRLNVCPRKTIVRHSRPYPNHDYEIVEILLYLFAGIVKNYQVEVSELRQQIAAGMSKAHVAREFGISRQTLYQYWRGVEGKPRP